MRDDSEFLGRVSTVVRVWFLSASQGGRSKPFEGDKWVGTCMIDQAGWSLVILFDTAAHGGWRVGRAFLMEAAPPLPVSVDGLEGPKRVAIIHHMDEGLE